MGLRFSKRVKIAPGVRLNLGLKGVSVSAGVRGASVTLGKSGLHGNVGLPGTGLSYRTKLASGASRGAPASDRAADAERLRRRRAELEAEAARLDAAALAVFDVHRDSPPPAAFAPGHGFSAPRPAGPSEPDAPPGQPRPAAWSRYVEDLTAWRAAKANAEASGGGEPEPALEARLERRLSGLRWPRETLVSFTVEAGGDRVRLDVDLPEIENLPAAELKVDARMLQIVEGPRTQTVLRELYARHLHAVLFRLVAESFAALPSVRTVNAAGHTQRRTPGGALEDVYVLQVRVDRDAWGAQDFAALDRLNPLHALERFELNRNLSARGVLSPIRLSS